MSIKIKTEKIIDRGVQYYKIKSITALDFKSLPQEYTDNRPYAYYSERDKSLYIGPSESSRTHYIQIGQQLHETTLNEKLDILKACGERLRKINKKLAKENKNWNGKETFII